MMKKYMLDTKVESNERLHAQFALLKLTAAAPLPPVTPGQFVQARIEASLGTLLRRPFSIHYVDEAKNGLWLLIRVVGDGSRALANYRTGDRLNLLLPLGNGFTLPSAPTEQRLLLIGGGAGVAPLLFLGERLKALGCRPTFLLGAKTKDALLQTEHFGTLGDVIAATDDGTFGEKGLVTDHSLLRATPFPFDRLYACGPKPMMRTIAQFAAARNIPCEVSLENMMPCGFGACLCCIEPTTDGNLRVCTEGPVFNANQLLWQT